MLFETYSFSSLLFSPFVELPAVKGMVLLYLSPMIWTRDTFDESYLKRKSLGWALGKNVLFSRKFSSKFWHSGGMVWRDLSQNTLPHIAINPPQWPSPQLPVDANGTELHNHSETCPQDSCWNMLKLYRLFITHRSRGSLQRTDGVVLMVEIC